MTQNQDKSNDAEQYLQILEDVIPEVLNEYKELNSKLDYVLSKIKNRKSNLSK